MRLCSELLIWLVTPKLNDQNGIQEHTCLHVCEKVTKTYNRSTLAGKPDEMFVIEISES